MSRDTIEQVRAQLLDNGYQPVPVCGPNDGGKKPMGGKGWQNATGIPAWHSDAPNTGINCRGLRAIDIDVDDLDAKGIRALIMARLGPAPVRTRSNSNRSLLLYRPAEGEPRKRKWRLDHKPHSQLGEERPHEDQIEALGSGQQFVTHGIHETGVPIEWLDSSPFDTPHNELSAITEEQLEAVMVEVFERFATPAARAQVAARTISAPIIPFSGHRSYDRAWAEARLHGEMRELAQTREGGRNDRLNLAVFNCARCVPHGLLTENEIDVAAMEACRTNGLASDKESGGLAAVQATVCSTMKKGKSNPYPLEQVQARRAQRQSQAIEGTSIPSKAVKPSGGDMMLNSHALLNLSAWFPKLFEKVSPLDGGAFEAVNAHDVVITATVAGIAGGILPIDLVADVLGMARNEAANRLADMVGFELRSSTSENRVDRKVQEEQRKQDRQAKQDAKDKAKRTRQAAMAKIYDESAASRVIKFQLHARALTAAAQASERAIAAHNQEILCRGKTIVRPVVVDAKGAGGAPTKVVKLTRVNNSYMRQLMDLAVAFEKPGPENGPPWVPVYPPPEVAELILSRWGHWPFPQLIGVISCPTLRPDGSLLTAQGYDPATRLYLMSDVTLPPISEAPTKADAEAALARLNELIREFPFNDEASRAVALSGLITPVVRGMLGRVPMHGVSGPAPGIGKSLLVDTASAIATGFTAEALSMSCEKPEQEKRLDAAILEAAPILNLDNVNGRLSSEKLCQIITAERVKIRVLGLSKTVEVESMTSVFLNGINVGLSVELARRTLMCRLDPKMEIPTDRDFESDPLEAVMANRGRYIADCLTIVMAYIAAGRPSRLPPKGKEFRAWSDNVRSALVWLGCADPRATMETARQDSPEQAERTEIFQAWEEEIGRDVELSTQQIIARAAYDPGVFQDDQREALRTALLTVAGQRGEISPDRLGKWLRDNRGQVVGDCRLERSACMRRGQYRWLLRAI